MSRDKEDKTVSDSAKDAQIAALEATQRALVARLEALRDELARQEAEIAHLSAALLAARAETPRG